jgi:hypothetical protein
VRSVKSEGVGAGGFSPGDFASRLANPRKKSVDNSVTVGARWKAFVSAGTRECALFTHLNWGDA